MGRAVFGNEKVRINIGTIDETSPSDIAHGESKRRCTHRCRCEFFVTISHSLFLDMCESGDLLDVENDAISSARRNLKACIT
jgi:hypothetical protein